MIKPDPSVVAPDKLGTVHMVGIGGSGMSGIARLFLAQGITVTGSDVRDSNNIHALRELGVTVHIGHDAANLGDAQTLVVTGALWQDNPEYVLAQQRGLTILHRSQALEWLTRGSRLVSVAGAHGKPTSTGMIVTGLRELGADPSFVNGGVVQSYGLSSAYGEGELFVVEADESDASFLNLLPVMAVVTNIDADHMETYGHDFEKLKKAFVDFLHRMPFYGTAILCTDDAAVRSIVPLVTCPVTSYGFDEGAEVRAVNVRAADGQMHFTVQRRNGVVLADLNMAELQRMRQQLPALQTGQTRHFHRHGVVKHDVFVFQHNRQTDGRFQESNRISHFRRFGPQHGLKSKGRKSGHFALFQL